MGHYTTFHFRAKLSFRLPEDIAATLQAQCGPWNPAHADYNSWAEGEAAPAGHDWAGWHLHPHPFFVLPRAWEIPRGQAEIDSSEPDFRRYADGGAQLVFTCNFKNYSQEIEHFVNWIAPYVRGRFGKRRRGRRRVWVGWIRPSESERNINIFLEHRPGLVRDQGPVVIFDYSRA